MNKKTKTEKYTDYQQRTICRILDSLYPAKGGDDSVTRMLCSDEVGLGKTYIAKGVIRGAALKKLNEGRNELKVLYLCPNLNIAEQNKKKLGLDTDDTNDDIKAGENRSSMLYLQILKGGNTSKSSTEDIVTEYEAATGRDADVPCKAKEISVSILAITPGTSIRLSGCGTAWEREFIMEMLYYSNVFPELREMIKIELENKKLRYESLFKNMNDEVSEKLDIFKQKLIEINKNESKGEDSFLNEENRKNKCADYSEYLKINIPINSNRDKAKEFWSELRGLFAKTTLELLSYDLVIMDEFQNFNYVLRSANGSVCDDGVSELVRSIFNNEKNNNKIKILMLSATPFKMLMGDLDEEELNNSGSTVDEKATLDTVCSFVSKSDNGLINSLRGYKNALAAYAAGESPDNTGIISKKSEFEKKMTKYFSRMERNAVLRELNNELNGRASEIKEEGEGLEGISQTEELTCLNLGCLCDYIDEFTVLIEGRKNAAIKYAKNIPYALSFMPNSHTSDDENGYKCKNHFLRMLRMLKSGRISREPQLNEIRSLLDNGGLLSLIDKDDLKLYRRPLGLEHGVFRSVLYKILHIEDTRENIDAPGAGGLLWIPPLTVKKESLGGVFYKYWGYGKTILFSSYVLIPRGIATLVSYEVKRRLLCRVFGNWNELSDDEKSAILKKIEEIKRKIRFLLNAIFFNGFLRKAIYIDNEGRNLVCNIINEIKKEDRFKEKEIVKNSYYFTDDVLNLLLENLLPFKDKNKQFQKKLYMILNAFFSYSDITPLLAVWAECMDKNKNPLELDYSEQMKMIKDYSERGRLDKVLEEYDYVEDNGEAIYVENNEGIVDKTSEIKSSKLLVTTYDRSSHEKEKTDDTDYTSGIYVDNFFARCIGSGTDDDKKSAIKHLRAAFNSPFAPFLFASTSMGQEGLNFHNYAERVINWNLPPNPVDFEQREGRINRRNSFSIRKTLIEKYGSFDESKNAGSIFDELFERARSEFVKPDSNDFVKCGMIPNWLLPYTEKEDDGSEAVKLAGIIRCVPYFMGDKQAEKYHNNLKLLQFYRAVIGQPDPEEFLEHLLGKNNDDEKDSKELQKLYLNFSPYRNADIF